MLISQACMTLKTTRGDLLQASLADVSLGRGIHPTWFSRFPFMGLPIDHVLVNPGFRAAEVEVLPSIGSDHFPLLASLAFAPKATQ